MTQPHSSNVHSTIAKGWTAHTPTTRSSNICLKWASGKPSHHEMCFSVTNEMWISVTSTMLQSACSVLQKEMFSNYKFRRGNLNQVKLHNYESELCITSDRNPTGISKREAIRSYNWGIKRITDLGIVWPRRPSKVKGNLCLPLFLVSSWISLAFSFLFFF